MFSLRVEEKSATLENRVVTVCVCVCVSCTHANSVGLGKLKNAFTV